MGLEAPHEIEEQVAKQKISSAGFLKKENASGCFLTLHGSLLPVAIRQLNISKFKGLQLQPHPPIPGSVCVVAPVWLACVLAIRQDPSGAAMPTACLHH